MATLPPSLRRVLSKRPLSFTVLVVFVLDRSLSMSEPRTYDYRWKWEHLVELVERLVTRFSRSKMSRAFRVGFVWFSDDVVSLSDGPRHYFEVVPENKALEVFRRSLEDNRPRGMTAMADALEEARRIIEEYMGDTRLPSEKYASVFLFTDGKETRRSVEDVARTAQLIYNDTAKRLAELNPRNRVSIATIAMGLDADRETLRDIASFLRESQRKVLEERGLIEYVDPPYHEKMFIDSPRDDRITREWEEAVRRFVERLSETAAV